MTRWNLFLLCKDESAVLQELRSWVLCVCWKGNINSGGLWPLGKQRQWPHDPGFLSQLGASVSSAQALRSPVQVQSETRPSTPASTHLVNYSWCHLMPSPHGD